MNAIGRIEEALARIEAASDAVRAPAPFRSASAGPDGGEAHERLRRAHSALRARVEGAIAEIDRLIGEDG